MQISEKELEDLIFDDLKTNAGLNLKYRGLKTDYTSFLEEGETNRVKWFRQVDLGPYGRIDIVGFYRRGGTIHVELMELKAVPIQISDFEQILRYEKGIRSFWGKRFRLSISKYLIGNGFQSGHYIHNNLYDFKVIEYEYDLSGISFDMHEGNWYRPDGENFNFIKSLHHAEEIHGYR